MNDQQRAAMQMALEALEGGLWDYGPGQDEHTKCDEVITALRESLAQPQCNPHPDAPHGFDRNASHNADRYVCECESWEQPQVEPVAWIHRYKTGAEQINTAPPETYVGWTHIPLFTTPPVVPQGCSYCNSDLFAGTKCNNCGKVFKAVAGSDDDTDKAAELVWHMQAQIEATIEATKERCAKICNRIVIENGGKTARNKTSFECAAAIRSMK